MTDTNVEKKLNQECDDCVAQCSEAYCINDGKLFNVISDNSCLCFPL